MRAVVLRAGQLEVREIADPIPGEGELLLRTLATAICASDVHFMDDHDAIPVARRAGMMYDANRDIVLGHEFVGEVIDYGSGCSKQFPIGTRVTAMPILLIEGGRAGTKVIGQHPEALGSFGELLVVSEAMARAVPDEVSNDAVALVDAFAVGEFYVRSSNIETGEIPIVIGAGAIGLSAVAALAARDIQPIVVSDYKADRLDLAQQFGAHVLVNPKERSPFEAWKELAVDRSCTKPAVVFECVGTGGMVQHIVDSCEMWTRVFAAGGWYTGDSLDCTAATHKGVTIQFGGGPHPEDWYGTLDAICEGRLDPLPSIGRVIGLGEVPEALDETRRGEGPPRVVVHPHDA
jgi:threonine dehydrogenase-like Zn-dependent dehydrogenase